MRSSERLGLHLPDVEDLMLRGLPLDAELGAGLLDLHRPDSTVGNLIDQFQDLFEIQFMSSQVSSSRSTCLARASSNRARP